MSALRLPLKRVVHPAHDGQPQWRHELRWLLNKATVYSQPSDVVHHYISQRNLRLRVEWTYSRQTRMEWSLRVDWTHSRQTRTEWVTESWLNTQQTDKDGVGDWELTEHTSDRQGWSGSLRVDWTHSRQTRSEWVTVTKLFILSP